MQLINGLFSIEISLILVVVGYGVFLDIYLVQRADELFQSTPYKHGCLDIFKIISTAVKCKVIDACSFHEKAIETLM